MARDLAIRVTLRKKTKLFNLTTDATVGDLRTAVAYGFHLSVHRIAIKQSVGNATTRLSADTAQLGTVLATAGGEATVIARDLGPQFSYRGVFIVEYAGPIFLMLLFFSRPAWIYGADRYGDAAADRPWAYSARLGVACWLAHFVKRELETFFVHQFSRATMPLANLFKNSIYYWSFACVVGYTLCHPSYVPPTEGSWAVPAAFVMWAACQVWNLRVHLALRRAGDAHRRAKATAAAAGGGAGGGGPRRRPPSGPLFARVSCPNYTAEVGGWLAFSVMTNTFYGYVFTVVGLAQMAVWAQKKHRAYVKQDPAYAYVSGVSGARRRAIIPFVL